MSDSKLIYLSIGSNLGDRATNLDQTISALPGAGVTVLRQSSFFETEPVDFLDQPWFLNCAVEARTSLTPEDLLATLQGIERLLGSKKVIARGPRIIDLDVLFYQTDIIQTAHIEIPHPRMAERRFVLVPLAEIAPELQHPVLHKSIAELLMSTRDQSIVREWQTKPTDAM